MRKLGYIVAALGALAVAVPSMASAETVVIKRHDHGGPYHARAEFREHRDNGWHRGWRHHSDRVVVIRRGHHHYHGY